MPKIKEVSNHPCHLLSLPSAKRFWCRHCMTVFEDAITRWHHSRSCRYGVVNNFMRRRELEAKALQNTTVLNPVEARLEHSIQMSDLASRNVEIATTSKQDSVILPEQDSFTCFICHQKFLSMEEMRMHVKFPCSNSKIITSHVPHPKHSVPVFIDDVPVRQPWQQSLHQQDQVNNAGIYRQATSHQSEQTSADVKGEEELETNYESTGTTLTFSRDKNGPDTITPTNIYVNELGETVIEVENLDLNTEGAELSLAHLLTQLSRQGIVFDKTRTAELQCKQEMSVGGASNILYTTETAYEAVIKEEEEQPTAEDAANTLAQLAGFRSFRNNQQPYEISTSDERPPTQMVESYNYGDYIAGQTIMSSSSEMDITYRYEYSESNEECEDANATGQTSQQAQDPHENTDLGSETQYRVVFNSSSGKYVPLSTPENSMEADEVNGNADAPEENQASEESTQEIIAEHYSAQPSKTDSLTETEKSKLSSGDLENNEVLVNTDKSCSSSEEKLRDTEDFTVPSLSLQEIVDTNSIEFDVPTSHQTHKTVTSLSSKPAAVVDEPSLQTVDNKAEPEQFPPQSSQENTTVFVEAQTEIQTFREENC